MGGLDLESRIPVDDQLDQLSHIVGSSSPFGDDAQQSILTAVDGVIRRLHRRHLPDVLRHEAQEPPDLLKGLILAIRCIVDGAGLVDGNLRPTQILLGDDLAQRALHHRRPCGEDHAGTLNHHREVREEGPTCGSASRYAEHGRGDGHLAEKPH